LLLSLNYSSFVPTLGSAVSPPAALDGCVKAFMESLAKHTTPLKLRESHYLNTGIKWVSAPIEDPIVTDNLAVNRVASAAHTVAEAGLRRVPRGVRMNVHSLL
jgi:hypothetical protein